MLVDVGLRNYYNWYFIYYFLKLVYIVCFWFCVKNFICVVFRFKKMWFFFMSLNVSDWVFLYICF